MSPDRPHRTQDDVDRVIARYRAEHAQLPELPVRATNRAMDATLRMWDSAEPDLLERARTALKALPDTAPPPSPATTADEVCLRRTFEAAGLRLEPFAAAAALSRARRDRT